ncbi:MAG TPA: aminopeptidase P family protein [Planctomycetes bacterium]|nr:aminopeptidase P family protein [Planctomycetota bacterium]
MNRESYTRRRNALRERLKGWVLLLGHDEAARNYGGNPYPFRQNSHVLYYSGMTRPGVALLLDMESGRDRLYGPKDCVEDVVWHGAQPTLAELAEGAGIEDVRSITQLRSDLRDIGDPLHYPPPYRGETCLRLMELRDSSADEIRRGVSKDLALAIAASRNQKDEAEIAQIEEALGITAAMHQAAMAMTRPGLLESDVAAEIQRIALSKSRAQSYTPIVTVHGEILHNVTYEGELEAGRLLLNDSGAESVLGYASDITRTFPVSGTFNERQRAVYEIVLRAQKECIQRIAPGVRYREVHLHAARVIAEGMKDLGLMRGDVDDAVTEGAHALFFPHGLGHMLGLDVHDMEDLGEDVVGYEPGQERSEQFGLGYLRCARSLESGMVVTCEPGIYFIPALIDQWEAEGRHRSFIDYETLRSWRDFGGIRIEDDVLCTDEGHRILGPSIPKEIADIEAAMQG